MGRFYESTAARYVDDKMFQAPHQLMAQAMQSKDAMIDKEVETVEAYDKLLKIQALEADNPRAQQILKEYHGKIDEVVNGISKNPLDYANYSRSIRELGREINTDWTSGEAYNMNNNKILYDKEIDAIDKLDAKLYEAGYKEKEKARILAKYNAEGGANWDSNLSKAKNNLDIAGGYHALNFDDGFLAHMKASSYSAKRDTKGGDGYIYTHKGSGKQLTPTQLAEATYKYMGADPAFQEAVNRRKEIGQDGFDNADLSNAMVRDKKGQLIGFTDDYYGRRLSATSSYAVNEKETEDTLGTDSAFMTRAGWARQDAKDKEETPELTYNNVFQLDGGNLKTFQSALVNTNTALNEVKTNAANVAKQLGIKEDTQAFKDIQNGKFGALAEKVKQGKLSKELYDNYTSTYRTNNARKTLLDAQTTEFYKWTVEKDIASPNIGKKGWTQNKQNQDAYREFIKDKGVKQTKDVPLTLSFNSMGIDKNLRKGFSDTFVQAFDNVIFKLQGTSKGEEEIRETQDGARLIYTADKTKAGKFKQNTDPNSKSKWITYVYIPDGNLSMQRLIKDKVVAKEDIAKPATEDDLGNVTNPGYVTFRNGESVGITIDNKTVGLASGLDNSGQANLGASVTMGNNRAIATIPTTAISSPTLKAYMQSKQEDFEFDRIDNQTDWNTIGTISKKIDGHTYHIKGNKAYEDGVELGNSADKKAVKKLILGY